MVRLTPHSWQTLVKKLQKLGFKGPYQEGKHPYMVKDDIVLTIPNPHKREISVDLLSRILRQASITREQWLKVST